MPKSAGCDQGGNSLNSKKFSYKSVNFTLWRRDKDRETYRSIKHQKQKFNISTSFPYLPTTDNSFRRVLTEVLAEVFLSFPTQVIVVISWKNP